MEDETSKIVRRLSAMGVYFMAACLPLFAAAVVWLVFWNAQQTREIQDQREASIRRMCEDSNRRHDNTIHKLDELIAIRVKTSSPAEVKRIVNSKASTVLLIEALAPKLNCDDQVRKALGND